MIIPIPTYPYISDSIEVFTIPTPHNLNSRSCLYGCNDYWRGKVTALQISLNDVYGMEYDITDAVVPDERLIGRFELYPTNNVYNFILLDTIFGDAYQVQWSTNKDECMRIRLW
jgi:hypothetical protein